MEYLRVKPPIPHDQIVALVEKIKNGSTPYIDGPVLAKLVMLCYLCGLKRGELIGLRIADVVDKYGKIRDSIRLNKDEIPLTLEAKACIRGYLDYLKLKGYSSRRSSSLFQDKKRNPYKDRLINKHIVKYIDSEITIAIDLEKLRQSGICHHYQELMNHGKWPSECLDATVEFSRKSKRHTIDIITGNVVPTGYRDNMMDKYLKLIEELEHNHDLNESETRCRMQSIKNSILEDVKLNEKTKKYLLIWLDNSAL